MEPLHLQPSNIWTHYLNILLLTGFTKGRLFIHPEKWQNNEILSRIFIHLPGITKTGVEAEKPRWTQHQTLPVESPVSPACLPSYSGDVIAHHIVTKHSTVNTWVASRQSSGLLYLEPNNQNTVCLTGLDKLEGPLTFEPRPRTGKA